MKQHRIYRNSIVRFNKNAYKKMNNGKAFNLFLLDGEVTGRMKCTLPSWSGLAYKIPRTYLDTCKDRAYLKQSGVYFYSERIMKRKIRFISAKPVSERTGKACYSEWWNI